MTRLVVSAGVYVRVNLHVCMCAFVCENGACACVHMCACAYVYVCVSTCMLCARMCMCLYDTPDLDDISQIQLSYTKNLNNFAEK